MALSSCKVLNESHSCDGSNTCGAWHSYYNILLTLYCSSPKVADATLAMLNISKLKIAPESERKAGRLPEGNFPPELQWVAAFFDHPTIPIPAWPILSEACTFTPLTTNKQ